MIGQSVARAKCILLVALTITFREAFGRPAPCACTLACDIFRIDFSCSGATTTFQRQRGEGTIVCSLNEYDDNSSRTFSSPCPPSLPFSLTIFCVNFLSQSLPSSSPCTFLTTTHPLGPVDPTVNTHIQSVNTFYTRHHMTRSRLTLFFVSSSNNTRSKRDRRGLPMAVLTVISSAAS